MTCVVPPGWAWLLSGIFLAAAWVMSPCGRGPAGDILCQPSGAMISNHLIVWLGKGQAADAVIAATARARLARWMASS